MKNPTPIPSLDPVRGLEYSLCLPEDESLLCQIELEEQWRRDMNDLELEPYLWSFQ